MRLADVVNTQYTLGEGTDRISILHRSVDTFQIVIDDVVIGPEIRGLEIGIAVWLSKAIDKLVPLPQTGSLYRCREPEDDKVGHSLIAERNDA